MKPRTSWSRYCLAKPGAEETYPWGEEELVAKVGGKGFAFIGPGHGQREVRPRRRRGGRVAGPVPGRDHDRATTWAGTAGTPSTWTGPVPVDEVRELVDASYDAAVAALPKSRRPAGRLICRPCDAPKHGSKHRVR